ncbi:porin [Burkholderia cepacia]|uniref:porin n=1 Tax=Burkholderia cepacia TaxID=292 RepID=UPI00075E6773|nr:porin [Burkholderia cepacia]KVS53642.1 porin [Burkholderia cepacia]KVS72855.1 porin [Burkholderia cepacia]RQT70677.1 porin [Burkholderia cepacia]RQT91452.1 porin [Burkholderia cepacia]RQZ66965.1 porin [Burkholderia cepacia]
MKKTLVAATLSGAFAITANAQSSVTLYGLIDAGITYTNNQGGHSAWQETSGSVNGSRWGLRGTEDLGGGLKAIFALENGFSINNGTLNQNNREFGRQAFVGLAHDNYGSLTLGRQYDSVVDYLGPLSLTGTQYGGTQFAHPFDNDNLNNSFRINNSIKYSSVNYGGLKFGALYGFSNSDQFSNNRAYSAGVSYTYAGFNIGAGYFQLNNNIAGLTSASMTNSGGAVAGDNTFVGKRQRVFGGGLNYTYGPATAGFVFTQSRVNQALGISAGASGVTTGLGLNGTFARFNNYEVNARYAFTPTLSLAGSYTYTAGFLDGRHPGWNQFNLQTDYALSKRTDVYVQGVYQRVSADGLGIGAYINGIDGASSNNKQIAVTAGLRHRF